MIHGVDHIAIAVHSIEESRAFYERLGLAIDEIEEVPQEGARVAMISCGSTRIELVEPIGDDSPVARFLERRGPGLHHLCLRSSDVVADDHQLRLAGVEVLRAEPSAGSGGSLVQFVHPRSAGGVLVELSQPSGQGPAERESGAEG